MTGDKPTGRIEGAACLEVGGAVEACPADGRPPRERVTGRIAASYCRLYFREERVERVERVEGIERIEGVESVEGVERIESVESAESVEGIESIESVGRTGSETACPGHVRFEEGRPTVSVLEVVGVAVQEQHRGAADEAGNRDEECRADRRCLDVARDFGCR